MPTSNPPLDESGDGVLIGKTVYCSVDVQIARLLETKGKNSTLTIYFPLSIREKVSKVGTVILRDFLPETGYSPSVINVMELKPKQKLKKERKPGKNAKPWPWPYLRYSDGPEYECRHGVGHSRGVHGCEGCCSDPNFPGNK